MSVTAVTLFVALALGTTPGTPRIDGVTAVPPNSYECPDLPGDGAGDDGSGPRWNADLPAEVTRWTWLVRDVFNSTCAPWVTEDALRIIACESVGDPDAYNPSTGVSGLFQMAPGWFGMLDDLGFEGVSPFDPHANAALAAWLWRTTGGWSHWECRS